MGSIGQSEPGPVLDPYLGLLPPFLQISTNFIEPGRIVAGRYLPPCMAGYITTSSYNYSIKEYGDVFFST